MADIIKKVKVMQPNGSFSDYIPIGAEASNVKTTDGESVQIKLNKKANYYNTVADMKADRSLKQGDMAVTLGYYSVNDGGNATYRIVNDESETDFQETLNNGKYASLVIENGEVNVRECGAKANNKTFDNHDIIQKLIDIDKTVIIPKGNYYTSPLILKGGSIIKGTNINYEVSEFGSNALDNLSILQCNQNCETFIDCSSACNITLEICLSSCETKSDYQNAVNVVNFVKLYNTCYSTFDLFILCLNNNGLSIDSSWENTFKRLYFRGILSPNVINIKCLGDGSSNISQNTFYDIQSEGFGSTILDTSEHCVFGHNKINSILIECTKYQPFVNSNENSTIQIPLFNISSGGNNIIDSIQINNFSTSKSALYNSQFYEHCLFNINNNNSWFFGYVINNIILDKGVVSPIQFLKQTGNSTEGSSYLIINNLISSTSNTIRNSMEGMNYLKIGNIITPSTNYNLKTSNTKSITEWYRPQNSGLVPLISDSTNYNYMNNESAVVKIPLTSQVIASFPVKTGETIKGVIKNNQPVTLIIKLLKRNNESIDTTVTIPTSSTYQLRTLLEVTDTTGTFGCIILGQTDGDGYITEIFHN